MTDFTWDISFQLTGTFLNTSLQQTPNVTATVTGTIVTDSDSGILQQADFISWSFTYSAPSVGFAGSASGDQSVLGFTGNVFSASGDTLSYVFDPVTSAPRAFFTDGTSQVAFGIDLAFHDFVQGDIQLQDIFFNKLDATVTQPFQIGAEVVATLADVSVVGTSEIKIDLSTIFNVAGNVTISDNDQLVSIDLSHLLSVGGNFTLTDNGALLTITLPGLTSVGGNFIVTGNTALTSISAGNLTTVNGSLDITNSGTADLSSLTTVNGSLDLTNSGTADLSSLTTVNGSLDVTDSGTADLGSLTTANGSLNITNSGTADLSTVTSVNGSLNISDNPTTITIDLSALLQAGAIIISDNGVITLNFGALVTAGGDVSITDNTHLLTVDLPNLTTVNGNLDISDSTSATSVNLGSLSTVGGNVDVSGDPSATSVNLGSLSTVTGNVDVSDDTSATTIDLGSLSTATGDVTVTSGADATLDASALGPGGGTVKLIGDNLTTSITLGSLDHLGGTLTVSSADGVTLTSHAGLTELDIAGTAHDDVLIGSATAANVINAGAGNDMMSGGAADDSFVFDFSVTRNTEFHHDFVSLANITSVAIGGSIYFKPAPIASITAWKVWDNALTTYANSQADNTGGDQFTAFTNSNPVAKNEGTIKLIDGYFHDYYATVLAGSGFDTITNFANHALSSTNSGGGNDGLLFNGLSGDQAALNYWGNWLSSTTANGNTTIDFHDVAHNGADIASITLTGVTTDVATLVHDGIVKFGTSTVSDWHV